MLNFTPSAVNPNTNTAANEYENQEEGKIWSVISFLVDVLRSPARAGRKFIVTMNNYFTLPKVIMNLRHLGIGCLGTARVRQGWPPLELSKDNIISKYN